MVKEKKLPEKATDEILSNTMLDRLASLSPFQLTVILLVAIFAFTAWSISPLIGQLDISDSRLTSSTAYQEALNDAATAKSRKNPDFLQTGSIRATPLVRFDYRISTRESFSDENKIEISKGYEAIFDYEAATILFGFLALLLVSANVLMSQAKESKDELIRIPKQRDKEDLSPDYFIESAEFARDRASNIYRRATYLLISGVLMAFIGIGVFYFSLTEEITKLQGLYSDGLIADLAQFVRSDQISDTNAEIIAKELGELALEVEKKTNSLNSIVHYLQLLRAFGMLFFIEAVAWFLLRQYRQLADDHKWAFGQYLKRANYQAANSLTDNKPQRQMALIASLLEEDHSGKLAAGETTEQLEGSKVVLQNPVFELVSKIIDSETAKTP